jgi:hypothetical protein
VKTAAARRTSYARYSVQFGRLCREDVRYRFLLALVAAGWRVRVDQKEWRSEGEPAILNLGKSVR